MKYHNIHFINKEENNQNDNTLIVYTKSYKYKLSQYIVKFQINQTQKYQIIQQILQAIYCVYKDYYFCNNIRAQNFVCSSTQISKAEYKFRWKLASLPYGYHCRQKISNEINCPLVWRKEYQPPESYSNQQLSESELSQSLVWNVGCILLHIQAKVHLLTNKESIKKFSQECVKRDCITLQPFGIKKLITGELGLLIKQMLKEDPNERMKSNQLFEIPKFATNISQYKQKQRKQIADLLICKQQQQTNSIISDQAQNLIRISSIFEKQHKLWYLTLQDFIVNLIKITQMKSLPLSKQERDAVIRIKQKNRRDFISNTNHHRQSSFLVKQANTLNNLITNEGSLQNFSIQQIESFIKPYKFYLDKTIFLFRFSNRISLKLSQIVTAKLKNGIKNKQISKNVYNKQVFHFRYIVIFMRLIYLQTLLQNLKLRQNVFNIPQCKQDINNIQYDNMDEKWLSFSCTSIYQALILYTTEKQEQCVKQLRNLVEEGENQANKWSSSFNAVIKNISCLDYHICTFHKFNPLYQLTLKQIVSTIDVYSVINKGFKSVPPYLQHISQQQNLKNIAYLIIGTFIESKMLYNHQNYFKYFSRFMMSQSSHDDQNVLQFSNKSLPFMYMSRAGQRHSQSLFQNIQSKQVFDFANYQKFLKKGDQERIKLHVSYLLEKFQF